jgi:hypothetical protein
VPPPRLRSKRSAPYWHCMPFVPIDPSDTMAQQHLAALHAQLAAAAGRAVIADVVAEL